MTGLIYEHPLNEKVRGYLRIEHLLDRLQKLSDADTLTDPLAFFHAIFETFELLEPLAVKTELLKDLNKEKQKLRHWFSVEGVDHSMVQNWINQIDEAYKILKNTGRFHHQLQNDRFLAGIRPRFTIAGGCCSFDIPALHYWLNRLSSEQQTDRQRWWLIFAPLHNALSLWLLLIRQSGMHSKECAEQGFFQHIAEQENLIRLVIPKDCLFFPMISGTKRRFSVRFLPIKDNQILPETLPFQLIVC
jgi:cell division protein ZapD